MKKWQKVVLKIVHFLLNYATFVIHIYSQDLWNFPKLTLWECLFHTKTFLLYIVFPTMRGGPWQFSLKKMNIFWPPFSKFIFPKSFRASTHQFWARSDRPFSRKMTFLLKIDHFEKCKSGQLSRHWRLPASNGRYQSIRRTLYCKKVLFLWFHLFYFLKYDPFFSWKSNKKWVFKNVHFLVYYATFENYAYGQVL